LLKWNRIWNLNENFFYDDLNKIFNRIINL